LYETNDNKTKQYLILTPVILKIYQPENNQCRHC